MIQNIATTRPHILLTQPLPEPVEKILLRDYEVHRLYLAHDANSMLSDIAPLIQGVVTGGAKGFSRELMAQLPALKIVAISGIGTDAVDLAYAARRGIYVTTTPDILTDDVADMAMGLIIATLRRMSEAEHIVRTGQWPGSTLPLARKVSGATLGIIGLGRVGQAIARRAVAFSMPVRYTSLTPCEHVDYTFVEDVHELARQVDVLVLAASADSGQVIVSDTVIEALGPDGYFINVARGKLVDEAALLDALIHRRIAGAGLDVFAREPHVPEAFFTLPNVTLQPHRASATTQTRIEMGMRVLENLAACFNGQQPPHRV
ncbi:2-hydroxyacid dehydrogenase [Shimwellia blattae]|uniref:Putative D-isomer specific 2-hydroxyacid dehydrogenase NAD-binding protein n=1 Tax=Shimwellia blattae (strain ATCC 29907 / DSM 4481 / JCM 1650 / NBRC 105725 / CDC 9005-74) TaxID=630626 RepID=I2B835_SHIBC|nr:2-hydroxyacid dehydrogenase [Shimwellia blattae]AFJ46689.1 putative D-isomer specific 2-hydroxyacid dehydrogenase NAD-binding protein [Shimwellia blattae DSM 4481 = NBRC 105725]GAB80267.1 putative dehydrogenase [Shimwellia blattae DSM 4481 = NBRC 105725]VDY64165.1 Glycerate dehydrogenase [Shimwellia blattae]VEC22293.1 Glycerate dehydrogenase [Shimwellia blattae]